jgi:hypothetical protein
MPSVLATLVAPGPDTVWVEDPRVGGGSDGELTKATSPTIEEPEGGQGARAEPGTVAPTSRGTGAGGRDEPPRTGDSCGAAERFAVGRRTRRCARGSDRQDRRGAAVPRRERDKTATSFLETAPVRMRELADRPFSRYPRAGEGADRMQRNEERPVRRWTLFPNDCGCGRFLRGLSRRDTPFRLACASERRTRRG